MNNERPFPQNNSAFSASMKRNRGKLILIALLLLGVILLLSESTFIVGEAEQSVVSRFGVIKRIVVNGHNDLHERYQ